MSKWIRIDGSPFAIRADRYCWTVAKLQDVTPDKNNPDGIRASEVTYHGTLQHVAVELLSRKVKASTAETLSGLVQAHSDAIEWIKNEIKGIPSITL